MVKAGSQFDQFLDPIRGLTHDHLNNLLVTEIASGRQGITDMILKAVLGIENSRDAALCIGAVGLLKSILCYHEHGLVGGNTRSRIGLIYG